MKIGLSTAAFYGRLETEDAAAHLRDFPVDTCEVFLQTRSEYTKAFGRLVKTRLMGLHCASVHPKGTLFETELFGRSDRQVEDAFDMLESVLQAGEAAGARYEVTHGPGMVRSRVRADRVYEFSSRMARAQGLARAHGMELLLENVSWCLMSTPEDVEMVGRLLPDAGFVLDVKQTYQAGVDPYTMVRAMGNRIRHVHALDRDTDGALCLPGQGVTDWPRLCQMLRDAGFDGAVVLEPYGAQAEDENALAESLHYLRYVFG